MSTLSAIAAVALVAAACNSSPTGTTASLCNQRVSPQPYTSGAFDVFPSAG